jgi:hypothetical protein
MQKFTILLVLTYTINTFSQTPDNKSLIADMNNFYNKEKIEKLETITTDILSGKSGLMDDELKFYALMYSSNVYSRDEYAKKDAQKGYDKLSELLVFAQKTSYAIPNKEAYIKSMSDYLIAYKNKHPEVKESVKEIENKAFAEMKAETVNKTKEINTTEANLTPKSTSDEKTVTLTVSGTGKTTEEARLNALRSAIEQAFGAFITSKTEVLNDNLVKDEIVSLTNGFFHNYEVLSQNELSNIGFSCILKVVVSISKLSTYLESKGGKTELKGALLAYNLKLKTLEKQAEYKSILNFTVVLDKLLYDSIDYSIDLSEEPKVYNENSVAVFLNMQAKYNNNIEDFKKLLLQSLRSISIDLKNVKDYQLLNIPIYSLYMGPIQEELTKSNGKKKIVRSEELFVFRNEATLNLVKEYFSKLNQVIQLFKVENGVSASIVGNSFFTYPTIQLSRKFYSRGVSLLPEVRESEQKSITFKIISYQIPEHYLSKDCGFCIRPIYFDPTVEQINIINIVQKLNTEMEKNWAQALYWTRYQHDYSIRKEWELRPTIVNLDNLNTNNQVFNIRFKHIIPVDELEKITSYSIDKIL